LKWQSSLYKNLFVDLQVGNPRRSAVVSDHLQLSPTSVSMKTLEVERRDMTILKYMKKTETSTEQNSLYMCLFVALSMSNRR
jgi:hypothetical protein